MAAYENESREIGGLGQSADLRKLSLSQVKFRRLSPQESLKFRQRFETTHPWIGQSRLAWAKYGSKIKIYQFEFQTCSLESGFRRRSSPNVSLLKACNSEGKLQQLLFVVGILIFNEFFVNYSGYVSHYLSGRIRIVSLERGLLKKR